MQRPGIFYVLEIKGKDETFFKVGITSRSVDLRYRNSALNDNYSYKIVHQHKGILCDLYKHEQTIIKEGLSYTPKFKFDGYSECVSELPISAQSYQHTSYTFLKTNVDHLSSLL